VNNFCTSSDADYDKLNEELGAENGEQENQENDADDMSSSSKNRDLTKSASEKSLDVAHKRSSKGDITKKSTTRGLNQTNTSKKTVTFKAGLTDERTYVAYRGALINRDQVNKLLFCLIKATRFD
jgi:hypothetical protein